MFATHVVINSIIICTEIILLGVGLFLIHSVTKTLNIGLIGAVLVGGYAYYATAASGPFAILWAVLCSGTYGALNYLVLRPYIQNRQPLLALLAGLCLWIITKSTTAVFFGTDGKFLTTNEYLPHLMVGFTAVIIALSLCAVRFLPHGRRLRASSQNPQVLNTIGVSEKKIQLWVFILCSVVAGVDGIFIGMYNSLVPSSGHGSFVYAFIALFVGGITSLGGLFIATLLLYIPTQLLVSGALGFAFGSESWQTAIFFLLALIVLRIRPRGLLTQKTRDA